MEESEEGGGGGSTNGQKNGDETRRRSRRSCAGQIKTYLEAGFIFGHFCGFFGHYH